VTVSHDAEHAPKSDIYVHHAQARGAGLSRDVQHKSIVLITDPPATSEPGIRQHFAQALFARWPSTERITVSIGSTQADHLRQTVIVNGSAPPLYVSRQQDGSSSSSCQQLRPARG
jgi:hypothetical protein